MEVGKQKSTSILQSEKARSYLVFVGFIVLAVTGFYTYLIDRHSVSQQWLYLLHSLIGIVFVPGLIVYTFLHFRRTLGQRRLTMILSGWLVFVMLTVIAYSGLDIVFRGRIQNLEWMHSIHVYLSIGLSVLLLLHIIGHRWFLSARRKEADNERYPGIPDRLGTYTLITLVSVAATVLILTFGYNVAMPEYSTSPAVQPYQTSYGEHPFRPSQTETADGQFIDKRQIAGSADCSDCHREIAEQWYASIHRQAASDKTYVTNINLLAKNKGMPATRYCEGCHAPIALLSGQLTEGGDHGGISGTSAFDEGISCLSCHNIERVIHEKGVASYLYKPHKDYLFSYEKQGLKKVIHNFLVKIKPEQHKKDMNRGVLGDPKMCATCHAQFMDKEINNWGWVKMQDEYTAWLNSPYSRHSDQSFSESDIKRCHDCHMPRVDGPGDPSADDNLKVASHRFLGANTIIPLLSNDNRQYLMTREFLQTGKMRVTIEEPRRHDATQTSKFIDEKLRARTETPYYFNLNEKADINVIVTNTGVGHNFPGGTTDINEAWLALDVIDAHGSIVYQSGQLDEQKNVQENAYFYRSLPIDRKGRLVWKHDLFNMVGNTYKNVVPAGKSDIISYRVEIPAWVKGPLTISAVLKYRKFNQLYATWALKEEYRELPIIDVARSSLVVPIREQSLVR